MPRGKGGKAGVGSDEDGAIEGGTAAPVGVRAGVRAEVTVANDVTLVVTRVLAGVPPVSTLPFFACRVSCKADPTVGQGDVRSVGGCFSDSTFCSMRLGLPTPLAR